jgi:hypothetical protein
MGADKKSKKMKKKSDSADLDEISISNSSKFPWKALVMICRSCGKAGHGDHAVDARTIRRDLKHGLRDAGDDVRVVETGCLDFCPGKAVQVVVASRSKPVQAVEISSDREISSLCALVRASMSTKAKK